MNALLQIGLSNAAVCGVMTVLLLPLARWLRRPALTHALCVLILLKMLTPPLFNLPLNWPSAAPPAAPRPLAVGIAATSHSFSTPPAVPRNSDPQSVSFEADETAVAFTPLPQDDSRPEMPQPAAPPAVPGKPPSRIWMAATERWRSWLLVSWIGSALVLAAVSLHRIIRLRRALRRATVPGPDVGPEVALLSERLGIRRGRIPRVRFTLGSASPMLVSLLRRPELVIPIHLWERLDRRQRQTLLLHELAHLRRGDHWVRYLELLATCLYWWHFATWLVRRALHEAEEHCCDAWVLWAAPDDSRTYMTTLLDAVDFLSQRARPRLAAAGVLASGMGQFHDLQRRLTMLRERKVQRNFGRGGLAGMVLISALALPMGAKIAGADDHAAADPSAAPPPPAAPAQIGPIASGPPASALADEARQPASATPATPVTPATPAGASPEPRTVGHGQSVAQELKQQLDAAGDVARLEAELAAARGNVERLSRQLEAARNKARANKPRHTQASLGYMNFTYDQRGAAGGAILAFDGRNGNLMWKLDVPLNSESVIRCYDNDTLLIKSADGYTRLVTAADGTLIRAWAPGVEAPPAKPEHGVNPFGISAPPANTVRPSPAQSSGLPPRDWQDAEKRMDRLEESVRALTEAVDRLAREQKEQRASPGRAAP